MSAQGARRAGGVLGGEGAGWALVENEPFVLHQECTQGTAFSAPTRSGGHGPLFLHPCTWRLRESGSVLPFPPLKYLLNQGDSPPLRHN